MGRALSWKTVFCCHLIISQLVDFLKCHSVKGNYLTFLFYLSFSLYLDKIGIFFESFTFVYLENCRIALRSPITDMSFLNQYFIIYITLKLYSRVLYNSNGSALWHSFSKSIAVQTQTAVHEKDINNEILENKNNIFDVQSFCDFVPAKFTFGQVLPHT